MLFLGMLVCQVCYCRKQASSNPQPLILFQKIDGTDFTLADRIAVAFRPSTSKAHNLAVFRLYYKNKLRFGQIGKDVMPPLFSFAIRKFGKNVLGSDCCISGPPAFHVYYRDSMCIRLPCLANRQLVGFQFTPADPVSLLEKVLSTVIAVRLVTVSFRPIA